ncbi:MAG: hypothetical protein JWN82_438 [Candidatus Saccharibacteria bacterium]|nr:hypothetical protein [Candidatus Saccharibacteria bacterium]
MKLPTISSQMKRYLLVGISVYLFELVIIIAAQALGANSVMAVAISFWAGLMVSFGLQKLVTFNDTRMHRRIILTQFAAVTLLVLCNFGFTLLVTWALQSHIPAAVARTIALGITTIWNFYLYKTHIFTDSKQPIVL